MLRILGDLVDFKIEGLGVSLHILSHLHKILAFISKPLLWEELRTGRQQH